MQIVSSFSGEARHKSQRLWSAGFSLDLGFSTKKIHSEECLKLCIYVWSLINRKWVCLLDPCHILKWFFAIFIAPEAEVGTQLFSSLLTPSSLFQFSFKRFLTLSSLEYERQSLNGKTRIDSVRRELKSWIPKGEGATTSNRLILVFILVQIIFNSARI